MKIETRDFGFLEIEEKNIITFKQPIFGFEEYTQYVLVNDSNMGNGICWLQSIEQKYVCFIMLNPLEVKKDYAPVVMQDVLIMLQAVPEDEMCIRDRRRYGEGNDELHQEQRSGTVCTGYACTGQPAAAVHFTAVTVIAVIIVCTGPVSYTHLDVYKRQGAGLSGYVPGQAGGIRRGSKCGDHPGHGAAEGVPVLRQSADHH